VGKSSLFLKNSDQTIITASERGYLKCLYQSGPYAPVASYQSRRGRIAHLT